MTYRDRLFCLLEAFCAARSLSEARVATLVRNDGKFFARIRAGASCTMDSYEHCVSWFANHWPPGLAWPAGVDRPAIVHLDPPAADAPTRDGLGADDGVGGVSAAGPVQPDQEAA
jgi:hypothetical protein